MRHTLPRAALAARTVDAAVDRGLLPDPVLRRLIRLLLRRRLAGLGPADVEARAERVRALVAELSSGPIAVATRDANDQHYEVPTELFELMLGGNLKYSSALWPVGVASLTAAEEAMLELTCERARLADGQDVLDLGCGWGSLALHVARRHPTSRVVAVSNSRTQREHIEKIAAVEGLDNLTVLTVDVNELGTTAGTEHVRPASFDRVVSVEMFEHVRNHAELTRRIATWLRPAGLLFVHVFAHRSEAYTFETGSSADWMARHFFTGGIMPSADLLPRVARGLEPADQWAVSGRHYARTLRAWLDRLDAARPRAIDLLDQTYGAGQGRAWFHRWRVFTIACEELFAFGGGDEWHVSHHLLRRPDSAPGPTGAR